ncbi:18872_t:CDS:2, partial [Racocetra persica]
QIEILFDTSLGFLIESEKNSQDYSKTALTFYVENFGKTEISIEEQNVELISEFQNELACDSKESLMNFSIYRQDPEFQIKSGTSSE